MNWRDIRRLLRRLWIGAGLLFTAWFVWSFQAHGVPDTTFSSDARVTVEHVDHSWRFVPTAPRNEVGLVFLPGGMVAPKAYGPLARALAERGYPVALVELPWRMAPTVSGEQTVADRARAARRTIDSTLPWVLAGHSRGAAIATRLLARSPSEYQAAALVATTHPRVDLSNLSIPVFKIGGTRDCIAPKDESEAAAPRLPRHTTWLWIDGGNHAQFGYYGFQFGDCRATISRNEQQQRLVALLSTVLAAARRQDASGVGRD